jgi:hypothetical protein
VRSGLLELARINSDGYVNAHDIANATANSSPQDLQLFDWDEQMLHNLLHHRLAIAFQIFEIQISTAQQISGPVGYRLTLSRE